MSAPLAIVASFGLIACGLYFAVSGKGATTKIKVFSVEVDGGLGSIMVIIGVVGLGLTAWWDWNTSTDDDIVPVEDIVPVAQHDAWGFGDDAYLDNLSTLCWEGDMEACDDLYWDSLPDSDYEYTGATCGERDAFEIERTCTERFP